MLYSVEFPGSESTPLQRLGDLFQLFKELGDAHLRSLSGCPSGFSRSQGRFSVLTQLLMDLFPNGAIRPEQRPQPTSGTPICGLFLEPVRPIVGF